MSIFNDYKKHFKKWSDCKSEAIRRTIYLRPAQDATREDLLINHEKQAEIENELSGMKIKKQLEKAIFLARAKGEAYVVFLDNPTEGGKLTANGKLNEYSRTIAVRQKLSKVGDYYTIDIDKQTIKVSPERVFLIEGDYDDKLQPISATKYVDNEIDALWDIIRSTLQILKKSSIHAMKIEGLDEMLANALQDKEVDDIKASLDDIAKKLNNDSAIFLDSNNSLESVSFSLNGITDICNELRGIIAGATLPELILFDKSPQGLSGSRKEQLEHYYSIIKSIQKGTAEIYNAVFQYVIVDYGDILYTFAPLNIETSKEQAEVRNLNLSSAQAIIMDLGLDAEDSLKVYKALDIIDDIDVNIVTREPFSDPYAGLGDEETN